jgi:hypothetical protein
MLVGTLLKKLYDYYNVKVNNDNIFVFAGLLFLCLPYNTEAVVWYSAKSYIIASFFLLISFICYLRYKETGKAKHIGISLTAFGLSLFAKEIGIVFPIIVLIIELKSHKENIRQKVFRIVFYFAILAIYFLVRFIVLGAFVGGYDEDVHLNFSMKMIIYNYFLYILKFFAFFRYVPVHNTVIYTVMAVLFIGLLVMFGRGIALSKEIKPALKLMTMLILTFIILLLPVINLETTFLSQVQSDRYGYLPSVAAVFILTTFIGFIPIKNVLKNTISIIIIIIFSYLTITTNMLWRDAAHRSENIVNSLIKLTNEETKDIYILNLPDNYRGIYMFRGGLKEALYNLDKNTASIKIYILAHQINNTNNAVVLTELTDYSKTITLPNGDTFIDIDTISFQKQSFIKINYIKRNKISFNILPNFYSSNYLFLYYDNEYFKSIIEQPEQVKY